MTLVLVQLLFALLVCIHPCVAQQRWYLTGAYDNTTKPEAPFLGESVSFADICLNTGNEESEDFRLLFGGTVARKRATSLEPSLIESIEYHLNMKDTDETASGCHRGMKVLRNVSYDMFGSVDYSTTYGFEVGLYDHRTETFLEKDWRQLLLGRLVCLTVSVESSCVDDTDGGSIDGVDSAEFVEVVQSTSSESHDFMYSMDLRKRFSLMSHTWEHSQAPEDGGVLADDHISPEVAASEPETPTSANVSVRVMTFNLWHNNPAAWVFGFEERHRRYIDRLTHFADIVVAESPDVVLVQEVRWDSAFGLKRLANLTAKSDNSRSRPFDVGSQVEHLAYFISAASSRSRGDGVAEDSYQVVYQPAMLLQELDPRAGTGGRNEEGVAILIKSSIRAPFTKDADADVGAAVDYRLLPRWIADSKDDHQRALLHARVSLGHGVGGAPEPPVLDVYTVHYSLSPRGRAMGVLDSWEFIHSHQDASDFQVLGGDFNAEPDEHTMQYFTDAGPMQAEVRDGRTEVVLDEMGEEVASPVVARGRPGECETGYHNSLASLRGESNTTPCPDFTDAWVWKATDMQRAAAAGERTAPSDLELLGYTFPACNPIKRIDYLMVRNTTRTDPSQMKWHGHIVDTRIIGQHPTAETAHLANAREGLGMLDKDSPIWASDHFGVVVDLVLYYH